MHPAVIVTTAYYAMLNAARAALSERGEYAKTHSGTWTLFSRHSSPGGSSTSDLSVLARRAQEARQQGDYEAAPASAVEAAEFVEGAARFIAAVEAMLGDGSGEAARS